MSDARRGTTGPTREEFDALKAQVNEQEAEINDLDARVSTLEGGSNPPNPSKDPSPDGTTVTDTNGEIVDGFGRTFKLVGTAGDYKIDMDGAVSGAGVVQLYAKDSACYQENYQGWWWYMPADEWVQTSSPTGEGPVPPDPQPGLTFSDDFDRLTLWNRDQPDDSLPWRPTRCYSPDEWDGWNCNNGRMLNPYKQPGAGALYGVDGSGNLFLAMDRADPKYGDAGGRGYVTSQINQLSFKQHGGYWECRMKAPRIKGTNTAFWLMNMQSWPPEIDIVEIVNNGRDTTRRSFHFLHGNVGKTEYSVLDAEGAYNPGFDYSDGFHRFAVEWTPSRVRHFVDDRLVVERSFAWAHPDGSAPGPASLLVNLAIGGGWPGPPQRAADFPAALAIDYIRVYA